MSVNLSWAKILIEQLIFQGVEHFCLAPGFRTTPLVHAIAANPKAKSVVHFDERGLGFHALGLAKASGKPVAIITTSGTAVGNLMPAVMEASADRIPLVLLTCDRPAELQKTMSNQTTDQCKIFGAFVLYFFALPSPCASLPKNFLATTIAEIVHHSRFPHKGPVHLNCPFVEPFLDEGSLPEPSLTRITHPKWILDDDEIDRWTNELRGIKKGVIILGAGRVNILPLSKKLNWPILPDILSSQRTLPSEWVVPYYHHLLKALPEMEADAVLYFGDACISKSLLAWMKTKQRIIHVADHPNRCDPNHCITDRIVCDPSQFCEKIAEHLTEKPKEWFLEWKSLSQKLEEAVLPLLEKNTEPGIIKNLETNQEGALFIANSMPIRDADMFFFPKTMCGPIFANRGLSGIDGNIATCAGIAEHMPVTAVIGDQSLLHDLNSLALCKNTKYPVRILCINNCGGGIFSLIQTGAKKKIREKYFAASHSFKFAELSKLFSLPEACFTEVLTDREENARLHTQIDQAAKEALCSSFSTVS